MNLESKEVARLLGEAYLAEVRVIESVDSDFSNKPGEKSGDFIDVILDALDEGKDIIGGKPSENMAYTFRQIGMEVPKKMYYDFFYIEFGDVVDVIYDKDKGKDKKRLKEKLDEYFQFCKNCVETLKDAQSYHNIIPTYPTLTLEVDEFMKSVHEDWIKE